MVFLQPLPDRLGIRRALAGLQRKSGLPAHAAKPRPPTLCRSSADFKLNDRVRTLTSTCCDAPGPRKVQPFASAADQKFGKTYQKAGNPTRPSRHLPEIWQDLPKSRQPARPPAALARNLARSAKKPATRPGPRGTCQKFGKSCQEAGNPTRPSRHLPEIWQDLPRSRQPGPAFRGTCQKFGKTYQKAGNRPGPPRHLLIRGLWVEC